MAIFNASLIHALNKIHPRPAFASGFRWHADPKANQTPLCKKKGCRSAMTLLVRLSGCAWRYSCSWRICSSGRRDGFYGEASAKLESDWRTLVSRKLNTRPDFCQSFRCKWVDGVPLWEVHVLHYLSPTRWCSGAAWWMFYLGDTTHAFHACPRCAIGYWSGKS